MAEAQNPAPAPLSKRAIFFRRLLSFVILWTVLLGALFSGQKVLSDYVFIVILLALAAAGLIEFYGMVNKLGLVCFSKWGIGAGALLLGATFCYISGEFGKAAPPSRVNDFETSLFILFVLGLCIRQFLAKHNTAGIVAISTTLFGLMYIPWLLNFIQKINFFGRGVEGNYYVLYFVLVTKFSDCGAYAVGSLIGKHKMIPRISPGKTWEGFGGAILVSTGASVIFYIAAPGHLFGMKMLHALILGVILSTGAVIGDLIESLFKREAGLKDSGHLFPGIGGILDLLDSLLFNAPLMYLYLRHVLTRP
ncbi:MAG TPA: CDP-archaeol synthase [Verrucomicrobiae bacterium]|jgi:phosphatidate cytidylyltransferase|nr:CDP-archaeol synthase [Verrucomicrobiae bacterium]